MINKEIYYAYCDLIAHLIKTKLNSEDEGFKVTKIHLDLDVTYGYLQSTKKTLDVVDFQGKEYTITIEESR